MDTDERLPRGIPAEAGRTAIEGLADADPEDAFDADDPPPGVVPRGGRLLGDLADVLRNAGLTVKEFDGWKQRSRSGNGFPAEGPAGIVVHHTASNPSWDGKRDVEYMTLQCDVKPMTNLYLDRSGAFWVLAAGATNTNGKGGPWGSIPKNSANSRVIGIEAANDGRGEAWPEGMQTSYVRGVAALAEAYDIDARNILAHHEWAPSRKVDPAGPSRFGTINPSKSWNMDKFRAAVNEARGRPGQVQVQPVAGPAAGAGATYVVQPGDSWWSITTSTLGDPAKNWPAVAAANGGADRTLRPGDVLTIPGGAPASSPAAAASGGVPPFPGEAKRPDQGPVVVAWQEALIARGVIADNADNRDGDYGDGMHEAVLELQRSWQWSDADGVAGKHTWSKLHGGT